MLFKFKFLFFLICFSISAFAGETGLWMKYELEFESSKAYKDPVYDLKSFQVRFKSPTGRTKVVDGFWDGSQRWKVRFAPDELGEWTWESESSDENNTGLNKQTGRFDCTENNRKETLFQHGPLQHKKGTYHISHSDGTPFLWIGCTAWNGTLKSTDEEWLSYLQNRAMNGYSVIQFVTTQWRGADKNSLGQVAFSGSGHIAINPEFFKHLDSKIDQINEQGLVAAPVLLWALATVQGRELSPGYYLPEEEATLLARYMVARYGGNQVIWILGGDGKYTGENEQRWKNIGRAVFKEDHSGLVALHPGGASWIGDAYATEDWLDIIGYQSGHSNSSHAINFITKGPMTSRWDKLPPRPIINMEPVYEEINPSIKATDIRNAAYWSMLNNPTAGFTYGANGIWSWLREGELILNHGFKGEDNSRWNKALLLPGSVQVGYLANFMQSIDWWALRPCNELLKIQPGDREPGDFIAVSRSLDYNTVVAYMPRAGTIELYNLYNNKYNVQWFNPVSNSIVKGKAVTKNGILRSTSPPGDDFLLILKRI